MLSLPLNNISPEMRPSTSISASPTPEGRSPSRRSPDHDDDEAGLDGCSLHPPQRSTSGGYPSTSSPSRVVATFRQVLAESPVFSSQGSKAIKEMPDAKQQQQLDWICTLCISKNSITTSLEVCAVCGWKRHDENCKSHMSSLTKASLEVAKKWNQDDDSVADTQQIKRRKNSFSSTTSIGSASTQKVSNKTIEPFFKRSKSALGDLASFLLASASSTSSRQLKTPHMSSEDEDIPTRPSKANVHLSPPPSIVPSPPLTSEARPPRPPQQRSAPNAQASPSRPPLPLRRGLEPTIMMPDLGSRPIPDEALDSSLEQPKRLLAMQKSEGSFDGASITLEELNSSTPASLVIPSVLSIPIDFIEAPDTCRVNASAQGTVSDEEQNHGIIGNGRVFHAEPYQCDQDEDNIPNRLERNFRMGSEKWGERQKSKANEAPPFKDASFDTEATEDLADISLQIDSIEHGPHSEDAVSISIFSDEQTSQLSTSGSKSHRRCDPFSYPFRLFLLVAIIIGSLVAALSSVIHWDKVGSKIRQAFGGSAPSALSNTTQESSSGTTPHLFSNVPTAAPLPLGDNFSSASSSNSSSFSIEWVRAESDVEGLSRDNAVKHVVLGRSGTILAVGSNQSAAIRVYQLQGKAWVQHGGEIGNGVASHVARKFAFTESAGLTLAVASSGSVRVYTSSASTPTWKQLGSDILLEGGNENHAEVSVALSSDGLTVAAGFVALTVPSHRNIFGSKYWGTVVVYSYDSASEEWIQVGSEIVLSRLNEADADVSQTGVEVQLSGNGKILAVRDWLTGNGHLEGQSVVEVYESTNSTAWHRMGDSVPSDQVEGAFVLSDDGSRLALANVLESRVLQYNQNQNEWIASTGSLPGGSSIAFAQNASILAIGVAAKKEAPGRVESFAFEHTATGNWSRIAPDLVGSSSSDDFGTSLSISRSATATLALGLRETVQVYQLRGE